MKNIWLKTLSIFLVLMMLLSLSAAIVGCSDSGEENTSENSADNSSAPSEETLPPETSASPILLENFSNYALIRPENPSSTLIEAINLLFRTLKELGDIDYKDDFYKEGVPAYSIGEYEIIVGKTNRAETKQFLSGLKYNDYGFAQIGDKIVIAGHSDEATMNAIDEFISSVVNRKDKEEGIFYSSKYDFIKKLDYKVDDFCIGDVSLDDYRIVYPKRSINSEKIAAEMIADAVARVSGIVVEVVSDDAEAVENEIIIGATNRNTEAEIAAMGEKLGTTEAVIKYNGKKINVFGLTSTAILVATNEFNSKFENANVDKLELAIEAEQLCKYDDSILSAMSFNVWVSGKTPERNERVLTMVRNYLPDTVGFQEVDSTWLTTLKDGLKDQYAYVGEGRDGGSKGEYNPIFYKKDLFNLIDSGTKWLSDTPDTVSKVPESSLNRIYTYALLEKKSDGTRIMVVNTHFDHTSAEARERQAQVLVKYLKSITDYPIVLTGDFNCVDSSSAYSKIISGGVKNSYDLADKKINKSATFTNYGTSNKIIDFVFVSPKNVAVISYKVCDEKINDDFPSDHHPVLIEYTILG